MLNIDINGAFKSYAQNWEWGIKFHPPVYEQRYSSVVQVLGHNLWEGSIKKVIDFGCGDLSLFPMLKNVKGIEHIVAVDIDEDLLVRHGYRVCPLISDYLKKREQPLKVEVYKGSISESHACLSNTDAVIGIEIIEHVYPDILEELPYNIFGIIKPKLVVLTTPNYEFNILFGTPSFPNGFRHHDHKFEWTRQQFQDWGNNLCQRYPNYIVEYYGIGPGPEGTEMYGCVTQMAVFVRKDIIKIEDVKSSNTQNGSDVQLNVTKDVQILENAINSAHSESNTNSNNNMHNNYKLIFEYNYPIFCDHRDRNQKLVDEAKYHLSRFRNMEEEYFDVDECVFKIPLNDLFELLLKEIDNIDELKQVLTNNDYTINDENFIILNDEYYGYNAYHDDDDDSMFHDDKTSTDQEIVDQDKLVELCPPEEDW